MTITDHLPALQIIVPLLFAPLIVLIQPRTLAWAAAAAVSLMTFAIAVTLAIAVQQGTSYSYEMGGWAAPFGITLAIDHFSVLLLLVVTGAGAAAMVAAKPSIDQEIEPHRQSMFYAAWLMALSGLIGIVIAGDAFNIFVFMEISSLASYVLIAGGPDRRALPAVFKYLITGTIGATFYLIGVGMIYMMTGTLNLADMAERLANVSALTPVLAAAGFITIGLALKAAVFPLHVWLPNAYAFSPHMVTVFLAACSTKVAIYVLLRFNFSVFEPNLPEQNVQFSFFLMVLAVLGILVASAVAMFEGHLKRVLAFSSVAQIGYIILGASLLSYGGLVASSMHIFNHALAKGALFLAVACLAMSFSDLRVGQLRGAAKKMPWSAAAFVIAGFSLVGIPGTAGFISKWLLIVAVFDYGPVGLVLAAIILISSLMALVYVWRIIETLYFGEPVETGADIREAPPLLLSVTWIAALANIYFGLFPDFATSLARGAATLLTGQAG